MRDIKRGVYIFAKKSVIPSNIFDLGIWPGFLTQVVGPVIVLVSSINCKEMDSMVFLNKIYSSIANLMYAFKI